MPWSISNVPSFAKNKSKQEQEIAVNAANAVLQKGGSEEDAIFASIAAVKAYNRRESQKKALEAPKRVTPAHISTLLQKAIVEATSPVVEENNRLPISREFLGKNALPVGQDRNLVSVELKDNFRLYHTFDTGEQIITDLSKIQGTVENYVHLSTTETSGGSAAVPNSRTFTIDTLANVPFILNHNFDLLDPDSFVISFKLNGRGVEVDYFAVDGNTIEVTTLIDTVDLKISIVVTN